MHPAARPGGLSFASNGEKLRTISTQSRFASRCAVSVMGQLFCNSQ